MTYICSKCHKEKEAKKFLITGSNNTSLCRECSQIDESGALTAKDGIVFECYVKSRTDDSKRYRVTAFAKGLVVCSCPGYFYNDNCAHSKYIKKSLSKKSL